ncbi:hypothetical protein I4U23_022087 [Adineta vaga]|nr:hypothetical protein I4U23_022087 [Adineta vaga]
MEQHGLFINLKLDQKMIFIWVWVWVGVGVGVGVGVDGVGVGVHFIINYNRTHTWKSIICIRKCHRVYGCGPFFRAKCINNCDLSVLSVYLTVDGLNTKETMASTDAHSLRSLISAAIQSLYPATARAGSIAIAAPTGGNDGSLALYPVNVVQVYHSSLVPSVSATGQSIPREYLDGPLAIDIDCLDSKFDHDFTKIKDISRTFRRGNQPYERPCGSYRYALKVKDKFGEDNTWLGMTGDDPNEWPVSYHGTGKHNALNIAEEGFKLSKSKRFLYGKGIYCTPELKIAQYYATSFIHEDTSYKCVIQNRVNPKYLKVIPKTETGIGIYWLSAADEDVDESEFIRPYAVVYAKLLLCLAKSMDFSALPTPLTIQQVSLYFYI